MSRYSRTPTDASVVSDYILRETREGNSAPDCSVPDSIESFLHMDRRVWDVQDAKGMLPSCFELKVNVLPGQEDRAKEEIKNLYLSQRRYLASNLMDRETRDKRNKDYRFPLKELKPLHDVLYRGKVALGRETMLKDIAMYLYKSMATNKELWKAANDWKLIKALCLQYAPTSTAFFGDAQPKEEEPIDPAMNHLFGEENAA
jgi:hypothetical protein